MCAQTDLVVKWLGKICLWSMGLWEQGTQDKELSRSLMADSLCKIELLEMKGGYKGGVTSIQEKKRDKKRKMGGGTGCLTLYRNKKAMRCNTPR